MLSYNLMTLYADKVYFDTGNFNLKAEGNVILEDGKQQIRAESLEVRFENGESILSLVK
jgi:lipopolysaccharide assembly outer membrane protein LptD (OstA)